MPTNPAAMQPSQTGVLEAAGGVFSAAESSAGLGDRFKSASTIWETRPTEGKAVFSLPVGNAKPSTQEHRSQCEKRGVSDAEESAGFQARHAKLSAVRRVNCLVVHLAALPQGPDNARPAVSQGTVCT